MSDIPPGVQRLWRLLSVFPVTDEQCRASGYNVQCVGAVVDHRASGDPTGLPFQAVASIRFLGDLTRTVSGHGVRAVLEESPGPYPDFNRDCDTLDEALDWIAKAREDLLASGIWHEFAFDPIADPD